MKTPKQYIQLITITLLLIGWQIAKGQDNTLYYMGTVPQTYYLNPANQPECDVHIGLTNATSFLTSNISASDLFWYDPEIDSVIHPLHPNANIDDFLNKFEDTESLNLTTAQTLLSFGFRVKEMYFSFDAIVKSSNEFAYSKDFASFLLKGNENNQVFDFSNLGLEVMDYTEVSINVSRNFGSQWQVGIRPKALFGLGTISTLNSSTTLKTNTEEWILDADYQARIAAVGVTIPVHEDGTYDNNGVIVFDSTLISSSGFQKVFSSNVGFGIDIGANYRPIESVQISLSVLDLGYINWKDNTHIASVKGSYSFRGIDPTVNDSINPIDVIIDTLKENLNLAGSGDAFKTTLNPKLLFGARYFLLPGFDIGVLSRTVFNKTFIDQQVILSANWHPFRQLSVSGSYSILDKHRSSFGFGLAFNLGPFNVYYILDNIPFNYDNVKLEESPVGIPLPVNMYNYNFRFGANIVIGGNKNKKLRQDKPLYNSSDWIL